MAWLASVIAVRCLSMIPAAEFALSRYYRPLVFLVLTGLSGPASFIALLKNYSPLYCRWCFNAYGCNNPCIRWFDTAPSHGKTGFCFPTEYAGSRYDFVYLCFLCGLKPNYPLNSFYAGFLLSLDFFSQAVYRFAPLLLFILFFRIQIVWL